MLSCIGDNDIEMANLRRLKIALMMSYIHVVVASNLNVRFLSNYLSFYSG